MAVISPPPPPQVAAQESRKRKKEHLHTLEDRYAGGGDTCVLIIYNVTVGGMHSYTCTCMEGGLYFINRSQPILADNFIIIPAAGK